VKIQTASGSSDAEMTLEGLLEFEAVRDFLYTRMRGYRDQSTGAQKAPGPSLVAEEGQVAALLRETVEELRAIRVALEQRAAGGSGPTAERPDV